MSFSLKKINNLGGRILIANEQNAHQRRLQQIYSRQPKNYESCSSLTTSRKLNRKSSQYQNDQHRKNIQHLFNFISRKKTIADRHKDPNDFFVYPVYFFRASKQENLKIKFKKHKQQKNHQTVNNLPWQSKMTGRYGIDVSTVRHHLPVLQQFDEQQLQQYTDSITRLIFNYNLNSQERFQYLRQCVLETALPHYPKQFADVVNQIFDQIAISLNLKKK